MSTDQVLQGKVQKIMESAASKFSRYRKPSCWVLWTITSQSLIIASLIICVAIIIKAREPIYFGMQLYGQPMVHFPASVEPAINIFPQNGNKQDQWDHSDNKRTTVSPVQILI